MGSKLGGTIINLNSSKHSRTRRMASTSVILALENKALKPTSLSILVNVVLVENSSHRPSKLPTRLTERASVKLFNCA